MLCKSLSFAAAAVAMALGPSLFAAAVVMVDPSPSNDPYPNDAFSGATVTGSSNRWWQHSGDDHDVQENVSDIFGTTTSWHISPGRTLFDNLAYWDISDDGNVPGPATGLNKNPIYVNFNTAAPVTIAGVQLSTGNRGDYHYEIIRFRLFASTDGGTTYTVPLSDVVVLPGPYDAAWNWPNYQATYGGSNLLITDTFGAPVTYQYYRAEFHVPNRNPNNILIRELDALAVPEPASLGVLSLAGLLALRRRR